jgi:GTP cyclohydrolase IB
VNPLLPASLEDVQSQSDDRGIAIDEVGISDLRHPLRVVGRDGEAQATVATITATVDLNADIRGTHMSRFIEALQDDLTVLDWTTCSAFVYRLRERLSSTRARVEWRFTYFLEHVAPVSRLPGLIDIDARVVAEAGRANGLGLGVRVPVTSLCPCSREISDYGAHNQRGYVDIDVLCNPDTTIWLEDLIEIAEAAASAPIYSVLKRVDERQVTMQAYENPVFVEDIARDVVLALRDDNRVAEFLVRVTNQESIHTHNAIAIVREGKAP